MSVISLHVLRRSVRSMSSYGRNGGLIESRRSNQPTGSRPPFHPTSTSLTPEHRLRFPRIRLIRRSFLLMGGG